MTCLDVLGLGRELDVQLRPGTSEVELTRTLNTAVARVAGGQAEEVVRRQVLVAASGALRRLAGRRCTAAFLTGRWPAAGRFGRMAWDAVDFALEVAESPRDPDADILRVQVLQLTVASRTGDPAATALLRAMVRVAYAGTGPRPATAPLERDGL